MTSKKWYNSLRVQIMLLMTLALLPLGAVAVYQTNRVKDQAVRNAELALLALTGQAAKEEELFIQRALGVARFFSNTAEGYADNPEECSRVLQQFVADNDNYSFIGILPPSGIMTCTSNGGTFDAKTGPYFDQLMETKTRTIVANRLAPLSQQSIFNISEPFEIDGEFAGFISISIPHRSLPQSMGELTDLGLVELLTFNTNAEILTARPDLVNAEAELPADRSLKTLSVQSGIAFTDENRRGELRTYTVVPIAGSPATVMGVWQTSSGFSDQLTSYIQPAVFPILMWCASLAVAMLSIYTLVLRHVSRLRQRMDEFSDNRRVDTDSPNAGVPNEFRTLNDNFDRLTDVIMREEARLEDTLREKNVLIKEVHHRVKNNLQLISSIMNMKIRTAQQDETKQVLSRLQDRVLSLATIHRDLYQSQHGGMVDAGSLVSDIVEKSVQVGVSFEEPLNFTTDIEQVMLYPDQAVPLSLLVAEGMTNTMKYLGVPGTSEPFLRASLNQIGDECIFSVSNSIGDAEQVESTGLGSQLINAFTIQLGGKIEIDQSENKYSMTLRFKIADFVPDARDF